MADQVSGSLPIVFAPQQENFGSRQEDRDYLRGKDCLIAILPQLCLEDHAGSFLRIRPDKSSIAYANQIDFNLHVFRNQVDPDACTVQRFTDANGGEYERLCPDNLMLYEQKVCPLTKGSPDWSKKNLPKILLHTFFFFSQNVAVPRRDDPSAPPYHPDARYAAYLRIWMETMKHLQAGLNASASRAAATETSSAVSAASYSQRGMLNPAIMCTDNVHWMETMQLVGGRFTNPKANLSLHTRDDPHQPYFFNTEMDPKRAMSFETIFELLNCSSAIDPEQIKMSNYRFRGTDGLFHYKFPHPKRVFWIAPHYSRQFWKLGIPPLMEIAPGSNISIADVREDANGARLLEVGKMLGHFKDNENGRPIINERYHAKVHASLSTEQRKFLIPLEAGVEGLTGSMFGTFGRQPPKDYDPGYYRGENRAYRQREQQLLLQAIESRSEGAAMTLETKQELISQKNREIMSRFATQMSEMLSVQFVHISPFTRAVMEFINDYKAKNQDSLCFQFIPTTADLDVADDWLVQLTLDLEQDGVIRGHFPVIRNLMSMFNQCDPVGSLHMNILNSGAQATSKTYASEKAENLCCPNTIIALQSETAKANTSKGNVRGGTKVLNEANESVMGMNPDILNTAQGRLHAGAVDVQASNLLKEALTSVKTVNKIFFTHPITGEREEKYLIRWSTGTYIINTNANIYLWDPAMLDRFIIQIFSDTQYAGRSTLEIAARKTQASSTKDFATKYRLIHAHLRLLHEAMTHEQMPCPNQTFSIILLLLILQEAADMGVASTTNLRKMEMVLAQERLLLCIRGIIYGFGKTIRPGANTGSPPYEYMDTLQLSGHLVSSGVCTIVSSLGLLKDMYEPPIRFDVIQGIVLRFITGGSNELEQKQMVAENNAMIDAVESVEAALLGAGVATPAPIKPPSFTLTAEEQVLVKARALQAKYHQKYTSPSSMAPPPRPPPRPATAQAPAAQVDSERAKETQRAARRLLNRIRSSPTSYSVEDWEYDPETWWGKRDRQTKLDAAPRLPSDNAFLTIELFPMPKEGSVSDKEGMRSLTEQLMCILPGKPMWAHVFETIKSLAATVSNVKKEVDGIEYTEAGRFFYFDANKLIVKRDWLVNNTRSLLEKAVLKIVPQFIEKKTTCLFGQDTTNKDFPYLFRRLEMMPPANKEPSILRSYEYISKQQRDLNKFDQLIKLAEEGIIAPGHFQDETKAVAVMAKKDASILVELPVVRAAEEVPVDRDDDDEEEEKKAAALPDDNEPPGLEKPIWVAPPPTVTPEIPGFVWGDLSQMASFIANCDLSTTFWMRQMKDWSLSSQELGRLNIWPEAGMREQITADYENRRVQMPFLPKLLDYPLGLGLETYKQLQARVAEDLNDPKSRPKYELRNHALHFAQCLGLGDTQTFDALNKGKVIPEMKRNTEKLKNQMVHFLAQKRKEREQDPSLRAAAQAEAQAIVDDQENHNNLIRADAEERLSDAEGSGSDTDDTASLPGLELEDGTRRWSSEPPPAKRQRQRPPQRASAALVVSVRHRNDAPPPDADLVNEDGFV